MEDFRNAPSGAIEPASDPNDTQGRRICRFTFSSDIRKNTTPTRVPSSSTRSRIVSSGLRPRAAATSASVRPVSGFSAALRKATSFSRSGEPASRHRFSQPSPGVRISLRMRARVSPSRMRSKVLGQPPSRLQGGRHASNPEAPAVYVYMSAVSRTPSRRAASTFSITAPSFGQFGSPAAFRW